MHAVPVNPLRSRSQPPTSSQLTTLKTHRLARVGIATGSGAGRFGVAGLTRTSSAGGDRTFIHRAPTATNGTGRARSGRAKDADRRSRRRDSRPRRGQGTVDGDADAKRTFVIHQQGDELIRRRRRSPDRPPRSRGSLAVERTDRHGDDASRPESCPRHRRLQHHPELPARPSRRRSCRDRSRSKCRRRRRSGSRGSETAGRCAPSRIPPRAAPPGASDATSAAHRRAGHPPSPVPRISIGCARIQSASAVRPHDQRDPGDRGGRGARRVIARRDPMDQRDRSERPEQRRAHLHRKHRPRPHAQPAPLRRAEQRAAGGVDRRRSASPARWCRAR